MAAQKEEVILEIKVDQGAAETELRRAEKAIINTKDEMKALNEAYKDNIVSQDEYVEHSLKLQAQLKKEQEVKKQQIKLMETESNSRNALRLKISALIKEMDNLDRTTVQGIKDTDRLQKEIAELVNELNKGSKAANLFKDNIGNYAESIKEAAKEININGVSIGNVVASMKALNNPVTAGVAGLTALAGAYVKSSSGAKDYAFAQDRLNFIVSTALETFGTFVAGGSGGGGEGPLSKLVGWYVNMSRYVPSLALLFRGFTKDLLDQSEAAAIAAENLRKLQVLQLRSAGISKGYLSDAESERRVRDDEEESYERRFKAIDNINKSLQNSFNVRAVVVAEEIKALKEANVNWQNREEIVAQVEAKQAELRDLEEEINGIVTENEMSRRAITKEMREQVELERIMAENARRTKRDRELFTPINQATGITQEQAGGVRRVQTDENSDTAVDIYGIAPEVFEQESKIAAARIQLSNDVNARIQANERRTAEYRKTVLNSTLEATADVTAQAAQLFEEQTAAYKILASAQALISAYISGQKAYESMVGIPGVGPTLAQIARAVAIAGGLQAVAQINGVGFAAGGYTGPGFGSPDSSGFKRAGIVHEGEYVTPKRLVTSSAAQPHIQALERMRVKGYADGGLVTNNSVMDGAAAVAAANAAKNTPPAVVSVREIIDTITRIQARENKSKV